MTPSPRSEPVPESNLAATSSECVGWWTARVTETGYERERANELGGYLPWNKTSTGESKATWHQQHRMGQARTGHLQQHTRHNTTRHGVCEFPTRSVCIDLSDGSMAYLTEPQRGLRTLLCNRHVTPGLDACAILRRVLRQAEQRRIIASSSRNPATHLQIRCFMDNWIQAGKELGRAICAASHEIHTM